MFGNARAVAALWGRFARELRFSHWEPRMRLPRMPTDPDPGSDPTHGARRPPQPDLRAGLLHQKLQVLDCCIALLRMPGLAFEPPLPHPGLGLRPELEGAAAGLGQDGMREAGQGLRSEGGGFPDGEASESDYGTASEGESWAPGSPKPCSTPAEDPPARPVLLVSRAGEVTLLPRQPADMLEAPQSEQAQAALAAHVEAQPAPASVAAAGAASAVPRGVAGALFCLREAGCGGEGVAEFVAHAPHVLVAHAPHVLVAHAPVTADELEERAAALAALGKYAAMCAASNLSAECCVQAASAVAHAAGTLLNEHCLDRPCCRASAGVRSSAVLLAGSDAAARAKVEGAAALSDARAFRAANPALAAGGAAGAGLAAFRSWRAWAGRGGGPGKAVAEEVLTFLCCYYAPSAQIVCLYDILLQAAGVGVAACRRWRGWAAARRRKRGRCGGGADLF